MSKAGAIGDCQNKSAHLSDDVFCITSRRNYAPPWQNITACGVPRKKPTDNIQIVRPLAPTTKTVAPHINLCESAHKNKKSKHNNQPNASSRSRCRRPYPDEDNPACSVGTSRRRRRKKGEHIHAYCLFHFIIFILHHPNVVLCRYHRLRIDKGWIRRTACGSTIDGAIQGRRVRGKRHDRRGV